MPSPKIRLNCCLCGKPFAQRTNVYPLDAEWLRHPDTTGTTSYRLAHARSATAY